MFVCMAMAVLFTHSIAAKPLGRPGELKRFEFESKHMGTMFRIVLYAANETIAKQAAQDAFARVADLDSIMSDYDAKSELMRLCRANDTDPGKPVTVSEDLFDVLEKGQAVSVASDGAFDVTVGPLVKLWRLARRTQRLPDPKALTEAKSQVGYEKVILDPERKTVALKVSGMRLDLGGIAKGYTADAVLTRLRLKFGLTRALVAASGDITCGDPPPGATGWTVEIAPLTNNQAPQSLLLANRAVSTSGDKEQFVEINGVRYSHVLDPKSGLGLTGRRSVTVIAPKGVQADSLTKAVSIMPVDQALALIEKIPDAAAYLVIKESDRAPDRVEFSKRFNGYLARKLQHK